MKKFWTVKQTANYINVSEDTIRRCILEKLITPVYLCGSGRACTRLDILSMRAIDQNALWDKVRIPAELFTGEEGGIE